MDIRKEQQQEGACKIIVLYERNLRGQLEIIG